MHLPQILTHHLFLEALGLQGVLKGPRGYLVNQPVLELVNSGIHNSGHIQLVFEARKSSNCLSQKHPELALLQGQKEKRGQGQTALTQGSGNKRGERIQLQQAGFTGACPVGQGVQTGTFFWFPLCPPLEKLTITRRPP